MLWLVPLTIAHVLLEVGGEIPFYSLQSSVAVGRRSYCNTLRLKCDGTCAETRFRLSAQQTSPFKSAGASIQSTTGSRGVRISGSNAG